MEYTCNDADIREAAFSLSIVPMVSVIDGRRIHLFSVCASQRRLAQHFCSICCRHSFLCFKEFFGDYKLNVFLCFFFFCFKQPVNNADFIIPVEIDGTVHQVGPLSA